MPDSTTKRPRRSRAWLLPREHGAWVELLAPAVTALILTRFHGVSLILTLAGLAGFLSHEPLLVLLGHRGGRTSRTYGLRARRLLALYGAIAVICLAIGLVMRPGAIGLVGSLSITGLPAVYFLFRKQEHTFVGELFAATTLAFFSLPVAVAGGVSTESAVTIGLVWTLCFCVATTAVHGVIRANKKRAPTRTWLFAAVVLAVTLQAVLVTCALLGWPADLLEMRHIVAFSPFVLLPIGLALRTPPTRRLPLLGIATALACVVTMIALVV